jgi:hypothetical protein
LINTSISKLGNTSRFFAGQIKGMMYILILSCIMSAFQTNPPVPDAEMLVCFRAYIHGEPLQLKKKYKNPFGEIFEISRFRFYAGRIAPVYSDAHFQPETRTTYHLIDFSDSLSTSLVVPVTSGICQGIQFLLGVDSLDQCRGAQAGDLDPAKGMFWTWNSGYQSFKIEGSSPSSSQPAHLIAYHIGGYRHPYSTVWKIRINTTDDLAFRITKENQMTIEIPIELDYFFDGPTPLHIRETPSCTTAGELAWKISENFIGSFNGLRLSKNP